MISKKELLIVLMQLVYSETLEGITMPSKMDVWLEFSHLLLMASDEYFYTLATLSQDTANLMISTLREFEKEHVDNPIIYQLFRVITSKSYKE